MILDNYYVHLILSAVAVAVMTGAAILRPGKTSRIGIVLALVWTASVVVEVSLDNHFDERIPHSAGLGETLELIDQNRGYHCLNVMARLCAWGGLVVCVVLFLCGARRKKPDRPTALE